MIIKLDFTNDDVTKAVLDLQMKSYKIEADIIGFEEIPPLKDTADALRNCGEIFYGYFIEENLAGIISYKLKGNIVDIYRVAVHPDYFRRGIAGKLLSFIEKQNPMDKITVTTGRENEPAVKLYLKMGYKVVMDIEIEKDFYITMFEKEIKQ